MSRDPIPTNPSLPSFLRTFRRPWPILGAGLVCTVIGLGLSQTSLIPLRLIFLAAGLLLAGIAVARRLQTTSWELEDRVESAGLLGISFFVVLLAYLSMDPSWDSGIFFLTALMIVSLGGSFLVLLPRTARRIAAVALVLFHFCGILTAVSSVPPRNDPPPWLSTMAWGHFYRHYLFFTYFTNAYHYYSPDPGPATLVWFHIEYANGTAAWKKIPNRHESPVGLHHQRMLAAAESTNQNQTGVPIMNPEFIKDWEQKFKRKYELFPGIPHAPGSEIVERRRVAADNYKFIDPQDGRLAPLMLLDELPPLVNQYSEPMEFARRLIASFARHIAHAYSTPDNPVQAVRVYRVVHTMMTPRELSEGKDPLDDTRFVPFYMGKYDPDGKLLDPEDPFLFWHVPIVRVSKRYPEPGTYIPPSLGGPMLSSHGAIPEGDPTKLINFVEIHATQSDKFYKASTKK